MIDRNSDPTGWDYLADLMSGRLHEEVLSLTATNTDQDRRIIEMATANEQKLLDAAQKINDTAESLKVTLESMKNKVDVLTAQAQAPTAAPEPENLDEEFAAFEAAMGNLASVGSSVGEASGSSDGDAGTPGLPNIQGDPIVGEPTEVPLAGSTGTTNPPVAGGGPLIDQQAPGVDVPTVPTQEPEAPAEGGDEGSSSPAPVDPAEVPAEGVAAGTDGTENTPAATQEGGPFDPAPAGDGSEWK